VVHQAGTHLQFLLQEVTKEYFYSSLAGMLAHHSVTTRIKFAAKPFKNWVEAMATSNYTSIILK